MQPSGQTPLDYLNQIAPKPQKPAIFRAGWRLYALIGIALVILVIIISVVASSLSASRIAPWQTLTARLASTEQIATSATGNLKNSQLRSLNSELKLYITNTNRDLQPINTSIGISAAKLPASVVQKESNAAMTARLEDGRLNAKYDSTYSREMGYQLSTVLTQLQQLYASSGSETNKVFLKSAYDNLLPTQQAIADFSASNE